MNQIKSPVFLLSVVILFLTGGCGAVGPDYVKPDLSLHQTWHTPLEGGLQAQAADPDMLATWWYTLGDPKLSEIIQRAVEGNLQLKDARARVREARARRNIAAAGFFPTLDGSGSASWTHSSGNNNSASSNELYSAGLDASWELDIFGGVHRTVEAAEADLEASEEDLRDVLVSLLSEVALNYIDVRTYQERITVAQNSLESQSQTYQLTRWRFEAGLNDELTVEQARYNMENTRSQIPTFRAAREAAMNRLAVLLGEQPGRVHSKLEEPAPIPVPPWSVAVGIPADLLRRRPDVRRAERYLAAQTARIGVATAELYPKFNLSGSIGLESFSLGDIFSPGLTIMGGPGITWAILKGGAIVQNIELQSALQQQALIEYERTILNAIEEVENALVSYAEAQKRQQALTEATIAAKKAAELAENKFKAGLTDFSAVLDAQRSFLSFQEQLCQTTGNVTANLVRLYKALGGGWKPIHTDCHETTLTMEN